MSIVVNKSNRRHQQPGIVLLLGLLLMAAIVASSVAIATSVSSSTRESKNIDDFIIASLAADSGIERGLAAIKIGRNNGRSIVDSCAAAASKTTPAAADCGPLTQTSMNVAKGDATAPTTPAQFSTASQTQAQPLTFPRIQVGQPISFDLFNYDSGTGALALNPPSQITVTGQAETTLGSLELSWTIIDKSGEPLFAGRQTLINNNLDGSTNTINLNDIAKADIESEGGKSTAAPPDLTQSLGIRVTVRIPQPPKNLDTSITSFQYLQQYNVDNVNIQTSADASKNNGSTNSSPNRINLFSRGTIGTAQSLKQASELWQPPASPLFNFVLFSESDIIPSGPGA